MGRHKERWPVSPELACAVPKAKRIALRGRGAPKRPSATPVSPTLEGRDARPIGDSGSLVPTAGRGAHSIKGPGRGHDPVQRPHHTGAVGRQVQDRHPRNRRAGCTSLHLRRRTDRGLVRPLLLGTAVQSPRRRNVQGRQTRRQRAPFRDRRGGARQQSAGPRDR